MVMPLETPRRVLADQELNIVRTGRKTRKWNGQLDYQYPHRNTAIARHESNRIILVVSGIAIHIMMVNSETADIDWYPRSRRCTL